MRTIAGTMMAMAPMMTGFVRSVLRVMGLSELWDTAVGRSAAMEGGADVDTSEEDEE